MCVSGGGVIPVWLCRLQPMWHAPRFLSLLRSNYILLSIIFSLPRTTATVVLYLLVLLLQKLLLLLNTLSFSSSRLSLILLSLIVFYLPLRGLWLIFILESRKKNYCVLLFNQISYHIFTFEVGTLSEIISIWLSFNTLLFYWSFSCS